MGHRHMPVSLPFLLLLHVEVTNPVGGVGLRVTRLKGSEL